MHRTATSDRRGRPALVASTKVAPFAGCWRLPGDALTVDRQQVPTSTLREHALSDETSMVLILPFQ